MRQLQLFTTAQLAAMCDRTASRNYSPERDAFRREHERHRTWGLAQRHSERLRRARDRDCDRGAAGTDTDPTRRGIPAPAPTPGPAAAPAPARTPRPARAPARDPAQGLTSTLVPAQASAPPSAPAAVISASAPAPSSASAPVPARVSAPAPAPALAPASTPAPAPAPTSTPAPAATSTPAPVPASAPAPAPAPAPLQFWFRLRRRHPSLAEGTAVTITAESATPATPDRRAGPEQNSPAFPAELAPLEWPRPHHHTSRNYRAEARPPAEDTTTPWDNISDIAPENALPRAESAFSRQIRKPPESRRRHLT